jgi:hypothetical protein
MKINKEKIDTVQDLLEKAISSQKSVDWLEAQVCQIIGQINELEEDEEANAQEIEKLVNQLATMIPRTKMELKCIDDLENQVKGFLKNEQEIKIKQKSQNANIQKDKLLPSNRSK